MNRGQYQVFSGGRIAHLELKNRLIRSATYEGAATEDGHVTDDLLSIYRRLAHGGVGAIITGHMAVAPNGKASDRQICIYEDASIPDIARIAKVVHASGDGCKVFAQLNHAGRQVLHDNTVAECVGPSAVTSPILDRQARELTAEEIEEIADCFALAIVRVKEAGFDGAQLHGAHGYLLSSFFSPYTNRRQDQYGGSIKKSIAILEQIITKARERIGDFPILIKINCTDHVEGGIDGDSFPSVARAIADLGVGAIEVSGGMWDCLARREDELGFFPLPIPEARTRINHPDKQSYFVPYAKDLDIETPIIVVGGHRNIEKLEEIMGRGGIDFFSFARPLINEPDLPNRWFEGRGGETAACVSCNACLLEVKSKVVKCVFKQSRIKQGIVKNVVPRVWRHIFK